MHGPDHDERLAQLRVGMASHASVQIASADASDEILRRTLLELHEPAYLAALSEPRTGEPVLLDEFAAPGMEPDTPVSAAVAASAFEGVRTAITAAQRILEGARYSYALCRPPGHHAGPAWLGGCCYLNNAAAAAQTLREGGAGPVGILDVDIHYPNGTSAMVARMGEVRLHSLHSAPVVNSPTLTVEPKSVRERLVEFAEPPSDADYLAALAREVELLSGSASVLVLSLGYDTVAGDPHGSWGFTPATFAAIGRVLGASELPVCVIQEGGYALDSLAACSHAFAGGLVGGERA